MMKTGNIFPRLEKTFED